MTKIIRVFWIIIAFLRAIIVFLTMFLSIATYTLLRLFVKHTPERAFKLRKLWLSYIAYPILNFKVKLKGTPSLSPALYVCNHRSFADPLVLCKYLDAFVIAKAEVADYPLINKGAELTGVLYVKRESQDSRTDTRLKMLETLKSGYNILVYPEGTVGIGKQTMVFKKGTFIEAAQNNFPIIPIAIEYKCPSDLWTIPNFIMQYFNQFSKWKTEVKLHFGEPILNSDGLIANELAHDWINKELKIMQKDWSQAFSN